MPHGTISTDSGQLNHSVHSCWLAIMVSFKYKPKYQTSQSRSMDRLFYHIEFYMMDFWLTWTRSAHLRHYLIIIQMSLVEKPTNINSLKQTINDCMQMLRSLLKITLIHPHQKLCNFSNKELFSFLFWLAKSL